MLICGMKKSIQTGRYESIDSDTATCHTQERRKPQVKVKMCIRVVSNAVH